MKINWEPIIAAIAGGLATALAVTLGAYYLLIPQVAAETTLVVKEANLEQVTSTYADFATAVARSTLEPEASTAVTAGRLRIAIYSNREVIAALVAAGEDVSSLPRAIHKMRAHVGAEEIPEDTLMRFLFP